MKVCNRCDIGTEFYATTSQPCKECVKLRNRRYYRRNDPASGLTCGQRNYCNARPHRLGQMREYRVTARLEALAHYSGGTMCCDCCRESELTFLALDHIVPIGRRDKSGRARDGSPRGGAALMAWLRKRGYPEGYRVLCHNCNLGRDINGGVCPHEKQNAKTA